MSRCQSTGLLRQSHPRKSLSAVPGDLERSYNVVVIDDNGDSEQSEQENEPPRDSEAGAKRTTSMDAEAGAEGKKTKQVYTVQQKKRITADTLVHMVPSNVAFYSKRSRIFAARSHRHLPACA